MTTLSPFYLFSFYSYLKFITAGVSYKKQENLEQLTLVQVKTDSRFINLNTILI